jgi:hypothetical protein
MKRVFFAAILGVMAMVSGCGVESPSADSEAAVSEKACHWKCGHCPANRVCALACVQSGNCGSTCVETMLCIQGYVFSDKSCSCVPQGGGEPCGNGTCGANEYCCNASCGICAPVGGVCTQQACAVL